MDSSDPNDICVLCCREITIYATGRCEHRVCYECSTRMRVLCDTNECPICRTLMPIVIFTHKPQVFTTLGTQYPFRDKKYNIIFEDASIQKKFELLLINKCKICHEYFYTFDKLQYHMRRKHELNFCDLCVYNLKIFTFERKCYTKSNLATHRRVGDSDDTSLRGHPICEFCDIRYVDDDALYLHLRKDHYFCHFCDADTHMSPFFNDYDNLRDHFQEDHYLCEEGECAREKFIGAFKTAIDLKAHIATTHTKNKSKAEIKQARTIDVGFTYGHRNNSSGSSSFRQTDSREGRFGSQRKRNIEENSIRMMNNQEQSRPIDTQSTQDFPHLSEGTRYELQPTSHNNSTQSSNINSFTVQSYTRHNPRRSMISSEDFPALSTATVAVTSEGFNNGEINFSINQNNRNVPPHSSNVSIHLTQKNLPYSNISGAHMNGVKSVGKKTTRFQEFRIENDDDKAPQKKDNPKWFTKNTVSNFEENFPKLKTKEKIKPERESISGLCDFTIPKDVAAVESKAAPEAHNDVVVEQTASGPFVTIKCRSKKKKQYKAAADQSNSRQEDSNKAQSFKMSSSYVHTNKLLDNQENKDPVLNIVTTVNLQNSVKRVEDGYWEEKVSFVSDDFPPLEAPPEVPKKPPGFDPVVRTPPPGFGSKVNSNSSNSPNCSPLTISLSSIARQIAVPNQKNNRNNNVKSKPVNLNINSEYSKPPDFDQRNHRLIDRICELTDSIQFKEFKILSGNYRQGKISAEMYHTKCLEVLGEEAFMEIYPELVSLLPDINKQHELLSAHNEFVNQFNYMGAIPKNCNDANLFIICEFCNQVLIQIDFVSHQFVYHGVTLPSKRK